MLTDTIYKLSIEHHQALERLENQKITIINYENEIDQIKNKVQQDRPLLMLTKEKYTIATVTAEIKSAFIKRTPDKYSGVLAEQITEQLAEQLTKKLIAGNYIQFTAEDDLERGYRKYIARLNVAARNEVF